MKKVVTGCLSTTKVVVCCWLCVAYANMGLCLWLPLWRNRFNCHFGCESSKFTFYSHLYNFMNSLEVKAGLINYLQRTFKRLYWYKINDNKLNINVMDSVDLGRTTSAPKSALYYELDKVRYPDLETCSIPVLSCSPRIKEGGQRVTCLLL